MNAMPWQKPICLFRLAYAFRILNRVLDAGEVRSSNSETCLSVRGMSRFMSSRISGLW